MSALPAWINPCISNDQQVQDFFRLPGQPDGVICHQANADGSGFIFQNGTFQLLSAEEYSRYLQSSPLLESMQVDGPLNQSPHSFASSIYSLPGLANASALGDAINECQPSIVPTPSCYAGGLDLSLPGEEFMTLEGPPPSDPIASVQLTPAQIKELELLAASYQTPCDAPATAEPAAAEPVTAEPATAESEGEIAKHKTLFGRRGYLDRDAARKGAMLKREPNPDIPHNYNLLFFTLTKLECATGSGVDKNGSPVSIGASAQAILYKELALMLVEAINGFLIQQNTDGRIMQKSIDGVKSHWALKGFSPMPDFLWDLGHQRTLVGMNLEELSFAGPGSEDVYHVQKVCSGWKILARETGRKIRDLDDCMPDMKIRMHLNQAQELLEMVDVPDPLFTAFGEFCDHVKGMLAC